MHTETIVHGIEANPLSYTFLSPSAKHNGFLSRPFNECWDVPFFALHLFAARIAQFVHLRLTLAMASLFTPRFREKISYQVYSRHLRKSELHIMLIFLTVQTVTCVLWGSEQKIRWNYKDGADSISSHWPPWMVCQQGLVLGWVVIATADGVWLSRVTAQGWILQLKYCHTCHSSISLAAPCQYHRTSNAADTQECEMGERFSLILKAFDVFAKTYLDVVPVASP